MRYKASKKGVKYKRRGEQAMNSGNLSVAATPAIVTLLLRKPGFTLGRLTSVALLGRRADAGSTPVRRRNTLRIILLDALKLT